MKAIALGITLSLSGLAAAQVLGVRLGVHSTCPDGLGGCWSGPYEALSDLKDITVSPKCDYSRWMALAKTAGGRLPNMDEIDRVVTRAGQFFSVRGYEVTAKGFLLTRAGQLYLSIPTEMSPLLLVPAVQGHEWDPGKGSERPLTKEQTAAYSKLPKRRPSKPLVLTGWLRRPKGQGSLAIEVTDFRLLER
ncbi:MAG TPA: hypothetical protein VG944_17710 [Fimbriimonas sp.]|nr:hypothetical protein [Fimbriimonas sp.]